MVSVSDQLGAAATAYAASRPTVGRLSNLTSTYYSVLEAVDTTGLSRRVLNHKQWTDLCVLC